MRRNSAWCFSSSSVKRTTASNALWSPSAVLAADLQHLGADEALDQAEQVRVGAALHLAQRAALGRLRNGSSSTSERPRGRKVLEKVEGTAADHVASRSPSARAWKSR
jgi:hypothetical protein